MTEVVGIKRMNGEKLIVSGGSRIWFCDGCGKSFTWDAASAVYGSERDLENQDLHRVWIACSKACREAMPVGFPKGIIRPKRSLVSVGRR